MMDGGSIGVGRVEAERLLEISYKLLSARDLVGSKHFAERALEADPLADGVDQILAVADVLLASLRRVNNQFDWYAVLQVPAPSSASADDPSSVVIKRSYRRLALLLHPERNRFPGADNAFRLVVDAFSVLSDPTKKSLFDAELRIAASHATSANATRSPTHAAAASDTFWTACSLCCYIHQYSREYLDLSLRCPNCRRPFRATELASPPPVVAGTDMYYCSWGFFPLGFPGGPAFTGGGGGPAPNFGSEWKPFYPMFPNRGNFKGVPSQQTHSDHRPQPSAQLPQGYSNLQNSGKKDNVVESQINAPATRTKKLARKNVGGGQKRRNLGVENNGRGAGVSGAWEASGSRTIDLEEEVIEDLNVNVKGVEDDPMAFHIDVDATDEILSNLHNISFLKDDTIPLRMP